MFLSKERDYEGNHFNGRLEPYFLLYATFKKLLTVTVMITTVVLKY